MVGWKTLPRPRAYVPQLSASTGYFIGQAYIFSPEEAADYLQPEFDCGLSIADILNPLFDKMEDKDIDEVAK